MAYVIVAEECKGCRTCARACPTRASNGEKKQAHSIDARRCIECGVCARGCPYGAIRDPQGNKPPRIKKSDWPKPYVWKEDCVGCEVCVAVCPFQALAMLEMDGEYIAGLYDTKACVGCGLCEQACPSHALQVLWPEPVKKTA
ncbi:MAG: 4Fe-4S dicluster domain-containing protein [Desulfomonile sp.]|jgi:formate hydrogenlyase subunit 6/NADH:ubiquinone oxidoreductase subunit I|nr:4Fe-4S binding protein [Deltaproteobacteria bacterium]